MSTSPLQNTSVGAKSGPLFGSGISRPSDLVDDSFARILRDLDANIAPPANTAQPVPTPASPDKAPAPQKQEAKAAEDKPEEAQGTSEIQRDNARLEARRHAGAAAGKATPADAAEPDADLAPEDAATLLAKPELQTAEADDAAKAGKPAKARKAAADETEAQPATTAVTPAAVQPEAEAATAKAATAAPAADSEAAAEDAAPAPTRGPAHRGAQLDASRQAARAEAAQQQSADAAQLTGQSGGSSFAAALAQQQPGGSAAAAARSEAAPTAFNPAALAAVAGAPADVGTRAAAAAAAASTATPIALAQPLHAPAFAGEMAARLSLAAADGVQEAQLHLNPSEMGPVAVQIVVDGQQAQISFHAEQADTRQVLEQGLPELAAALRDQGLTLSGGGVFQQAPQQQQSQQSQQDAASAQGGNGGSRPGSTRIGGDSVEPAAERIATPMRAPRGVVDVYA